MSAATPTTTVAPTTTATPTRKALCLEYERVFEADVVDSASVGAAWKALVAACESEEEARHLWACYTYRAVY